jgi:iron-sulfur cluster insertion protein
VAEWLKASVLKTDKRASVSRVRIPSHPGFGIKMSISISENAAKKIVQLSEKQEDLLFLRIQIKSGGCSGLRSLFLVEKQKKENDICIEYKEAKVIVDPLSLSFIQGSELDYLEEMMVSQFVLKNPNAQSACGCGESFSL